MLNPAALVTLNEWTNRTFVLPVAVFFPDQPVQQPLRVVRLVEGERDGDLTLDEIARVADDLEVLGTRIVLFSGGEPLLRPEVFEIAAMFRARGVSLHLHTSGVLLDRLLARVADAFSRVIVSLDSPDETGYRSIRVVGALPTIERGVARLRALRPELPVSARTTLHRLNFRDLPRLVEHAKAMSVDSVSFLPADISPRAFGRSGGADGAELALDRDEIVEFADVVERTIAEREDDFAGGFIAESPAKLRRLPQYYAALAGLAPFPAVECNAPYMSVVIEADGTVRPCFFHAPLGSVRQAPLRTIVRQNLPAFRETLSVPDNPVCERCVCSMKTGWRSAPWR